MSAIWRGGGPWVALGRFHSGLELLGKCMALGKQWGTLFEGIRGLGACDSAVWLLQWRSRSCETRLFPFSDLVKIESGDLRLFVCDPEERCNMFQESQETAKWNQSSVEPQAVRREDPHESVWHCLVSLVSLTLLTSSLARPSKGAGGHRLWAALSPTPEANPPGPLQSWGRHGSPGHC